MTDDRPVSEAAEVVGKPYADSFGALLHARNIAIIGASNDPETLSGRPLRHLRQQGFVGNIYPVNPTRETVQGLPAYPSILSVPEVIDLAMVAVRAELVPQVLRECAKAGVKHAVVVSSGFGEGQGAGADLRAEVVDLLSTTTMRVIGPNCEGVLSMPNAMPLTFSPVVDQDRTGIALKTGDVAVLSQSGGLGFAVAQWGAAIGLGFDYIISTGNEIDVDVPELAEHLINETDARVVALLIEGFTSPERVTRIAARAHELGKFLVVAKFGRSAVGTRAALAHTRHDAGSAADYRALFEGAGIPQTADEEELIDTIQILAKSPMLRGRRIAIVTTSGGAGVWLADACSDAGLEIPELSAEIQGRLAEGMPGYGSPVNPVDLTAQFLAGQTFAAVAELLFESGEVDAVVMVTSLASPGRLEREQEGLAVLRTKFDLPLLVFSYTRPAQSAIDTLETLGLPWFGSSTRTARALGVLATAAGVTA